MEQTPFSCSILFLSMDKTLTAPIIIEFEPIQQRLNKKKREFFHQSIF